MERKTITNEHKMDGQVLEEDTDEGLALTFGKRQINEDQTAKTASAQKDYEKETIAIQQLEKD